MNKNWLPYLLLGLMVLAVIFIRQCKTVNSPEVKNDKKQKGPDRNRGFDRRTSFIHYTQHAKCRMECRHISQAEVETIMKNGSVNYRKSDIKQFPCPLYALEGNTEDDQRVRIVFAQCDLKTKVVTVIDLNKEWKCQCPGDDASQAVLHDKSQDQ
jgi:hypothetical protein